MFQEMMVASGGGGSYQVESGSGTLSTASNTKITLPFKPRYLEYTTKDASGSGATYFQTVIYDENCQITQDNSKDYICLVNHSSEFKLVDLGSSGIGANRGELISVDIDGFTVGKCDTTGYGTSLKWVATN